MTNSRHTYGHVGRQILKKADPDEVPPAWRFNWAAARPPLFILAARRLSYRVAERCSPLSYQRVTHAREARRRCTADPGPLRTRGLEGSRACSASLRAALRPGQRGLCLTLRPSGARRKTPSSRWPPAGADRWLRRAEETSCPAAAVRIRSLEPSARQACASA